MFGRDPIGTRWVGGNQPILDDLHMNIPKASFVAGPLRPWLLANASPAFARRRSARQIVASVLVAAWGASR